MKLGVQIQPRNAAWGRPSAGWSAEEKKRLQEFQDRTNPAPLMFLEDFGMAREAKRRYPNRLIVFREWTQTDRYPDYRGSGVALYNSLRRFSEDGIVVNVWNEPDTYSRSIVDLMVRVGVEFCNEAARRGDAFVIGNWATGHPDDRAFPTLKPFFQAVRDSGLFLGAHEYGTYKGMRYVDPLGRSSVYPWRVGRFKFLLDYCRANLNGWSPSILFTEFGRDHSQYAGDDTVKRGYKDSISAALYAQELIDTVDALYIQEPSIKAAFTFCMGNGGTPHASDGHDGDDWSTHNVFDEGWMRVIESYAQNSKPAPVPVPAPTPPPSDMQRALAEITQHVEAAEQHIGAAKHKLGQLKGG